MKNKYCDTKTMKSFDEENLFIVYKNYISKTSKKTNKKHTIVKIFTVGHGLLPNRHLPRLSKKVNRYGAHTVINNIHTQRS